MRLLSENDDAYVVQVKRLFKKELANVPSMFNSVELGTFFWALNFLSYLGETLLLNDTF